MRQFTKYHPFACWLLLCLGAALQADSQFMLSTGGAMAALNGTVGTTAPATAPLNYMTTLPAPGSVATTPVNGPIGAINFTPTIPNDRSLNFAYQSAIAWWSGYFNYTQAAQSLNLSGADFFTKIAALGAANYILGIPFTQFRDYGGRRATMIMRANDQSPVHFPMIQEINNATVQFNMYTPVVSSYSFEIPLSF